MVEVDGAQGQAGQVDGCSRGILESEGDLNEGHVTELAQGLELLDELVEGEVLVGVGADGDVADASQEVDGNEGCRARLQRSGRVLTKKPMRGSVSTRLRPAMAVPTTMSC